MNKIKAWYLKRKTKDYIWNSIGKLVKEVINPKCLNY